MPFMSVGVPPNRAETKTPSWILHRVVDADRQRVLARSNIAAEVVDVRGDEAVLGVADRPAVEPDLA